MKLSTNQVIFLKMAKSNTAPRAISNKTGRSLYKLGLVKCSSTFGWYLTTEGVRTLTEIEANKAEKES